MAYLAIIFGLLGLILIHELGHFLMARATGVRATRFMVGFPPIVWSFRRGETEYGIGATMLGGYVKLPGMFRPSGADAAERLEADIQELVEAAAGEDQADALVRGLGRLRRAADPDALGDAAAALAHAVERGSDDDEVTVTRRRRVLRALADLRDDCHPRAYWRASLWRRMAVIAAGPAANIITGLALLLVLTMWFTPKFSVDWVVAEVVPDSPAAAAGIRGGDVIKSWNGTDGTGADLAEAVEDGRGSPVDIVVDSPRGELSTRITPSEIEGEQAIGIRFTARDVTREGYLRPGFSEAVSETWTDTRRLIVGMTTGLARLVYQPEAREEVGTVVGVVQDAPEIQESGRYWHYLVFLSLAIAIFNLLPLLPLDGGHLAFGLLEALRRGRPLPRLAFEQASFVGLALILILFAMGLQNDIET